MASPSYQFVRDEGQRGMEYSAAARGGAFSGNALRELSRFNQGLASSEYGNWWNRVAGLAGAGQTANDNLGNAYLSTGNDIRNSLYAQGNARASGIMGAANSVTNSINSGLNNYLLYRGGYFGGG
jgi:hypothetical protein